MRRLLLTLALILQLLAIPAPALAQAPSGCTGPLRLGVPIGGLTSLPTGGEAFRCYVIGLYGYILGLAVVLAAIVSTYAGYLFLTSGGDPAKQTHARELIIGALSGLALLILAATVLRFIGIGGSSSGTQTEGLEVPPSQRQNIERQR